MLKNRIMIGAVAASAALVPIAGVTALTAGPASAGKTKTISCSKLKGSDTKKAQLLDCNGNTGGSSQKFNTSTLLAGGTITWANGKTTTFGAPTIGSGSACPTTDTDATATGAVTGDTTKSAKPIPGVFQGEVCVTSAGKLSLPPGHPLTAN